MWPLGQATYALYETAKLVSRSHIEHDERPFLLWPNTQKSDTIGVITKEGGEHYHEIDPLYSGHLPLKSYLRLALLVFWIFLDYRNLFSIVVFQKERGHEEDIDCGYLFT